MVHLYTSLLEFAAAHGGNVKIAGKLEERDFFLCGTSIWFSKAMVQASPFSSLEHATSYARDLWFNRSPIQSWLDVFSAHLHIDEAAKFAPGPIMLELEQFGRKYRRKFGFVFITSTNKKLSHQILDEVKARYENPLSVEIGITSREEFILIERKLARLWDRLIQENVRETPEESGEVVQDSMEEDDVVNNDSSEEVVSTVNKAPKITFDLNKIPEENCFV
ncbi:Uric acid degradation bifunctional protein TTL [Arachis hypogaea]|nr:Uric acid degradation bifunctional protein TTL [Arachis hypogaea]